MGCPSPQSGAALLSRTAQTCCHIWHGTTQTLFQRKVLQRSHFPAGFVMPRFKRMWGSLLRALSYTANSILQDHVNSMTCFYSRAAVKSLFAHGGFLKVRGIFLRRNVVSTRSNNRESLSLSVKMLTAPYTLPATRTQRCSSPHSLLWASFLQGRNWKCGSSNLTHVYLWCISLTNYDQHFLS